MLGILKFFRRRRLLKRPVPPGWIDAVSDSIPIFGHFSDEEAQNFLSHLKILVWEKHWVAVRDFELDEYRKLVIASQIARMTRGLPLSVLDGLRELVIYGEVFTHPEEELPGPVYGEAHPFGTVVLSWPAVEQGVRFPCDGFNTVLHEVAHILDMTNGYFDGTPLLHSGRDYEAWGRVFQKYFDAIRDNPEESFLDLYGATDEAEFFAVATEAFFELPDHLSFEAPDLFGELRRYYRVDPLIMPCECESHDDAGDAGDENEEIEEVGRPLFLPRDPRDYPFF